MKTNKIFTGKKTDMAREKRPNRFSLTSVDFRYIYKAFRKVATVVVVVVVVFSIVAIIVDSNNDDLTQR